MYKPRDNWSRGLLNNNTVDLSSASTFNVADLRLAFQIQKWMERNARAGARYTESLCRLILAFRLVMSGCSVPSISEALNSCDCVRGTADFFY